MDKREAIKNICELIDDPTFPARRGIMDYIQLLLANYDPDESIDLYEYAQSLFKKHDDINKV